MPEVKHFYRLVKPDFEYCFNIETTEPLAADQLITLRWLLAETFEKGNLKAKPFLKSLKDAVEVGPRLNFETVYSTSAVAICHACGLNQVTRVECSRRYFVSPDREQFIAQKHDRMTECPYQPAKHL